MNILNNHKNRILFLVIGMILFNGNLYAQHLQRPQGPPPLPDSTKIEQMIDQLAIDLSLTSEQKSKIRELHFAHFSQVRKNIEKDHKEREKQREKMEKMRKEFEDQVKNLLTDEQKTKFDKLMKMRGPKSGPEPPGQKRQ